MPWLLVVVGVLVYANSLSGPFIYDDHASIVDNKPIRHLWPPRWIVVQPPDSPAAGRPVVGLSLAVNYAIGELDVRGYHAFNIAVHILGAMIFFG
ncbi:MAG: hypothetical protein V3U29_00715, partial [Phycisphaeraceae bacterium]